MHTTRFILATFLTLSSGIFVPHEAQAQVTTQSPAAPSIWKTLELPAGGTFVQDPKYKHISYYFINAGLSQQDYAKCGLYHSVDMGQTWRKIQSFFSFQALFVHPDSGELFALIQDKVIVPDNQGFLTIATMSKAITSVDGTHWKDIMGLQRGVQLDGISVDPDHPNRVRLSGWAFNGFYLVATDDSYSDWKRVWIPNGPTF